MYTVPLSPPAHHCSMGGMQKMDSYSVLKAPLTTESAMKKIEDNNTLVRKKHALQAHLMRACWCLWAQRTRRGTGSLAAAQKGAVCDKGSGSKHRRRTGIQEHSQAQVCCHEPGGQRHGSNGQGSQLITLSSAMGHEQHSRISLSSGALDPQLASSMSSSPPYHHSALSDSELGILCTACASACGLSCRHQHASQEINILPTLAK